MDESVDAFRYKTLTEAYILVEFRQWEKSCGQILESLYDQN